MIERDALTAALGIRQASTCRDSHARRQLSTALQFSAAADISHASGKAPMAALLDLGAAALPRIAAEATGKPAASALPGRTLTWTHS